MGLTDWTMLYTRRVTTRGLKGGTTETIAYCVEIDLKELDAKARKAARNVGAKAKVGPLRLTITARKEHTNG